MKMNQQSSRRKFLKAGGIFIAAPGISAAASFLAKGGGRKSLSVDAHFGRGDLLTE
jgi:hypothetical protein